MLPIFLYSFTCTFWPKIRAVGRLISLIALMALFLNCSFNAHFVCYIFQFVYFHLQVDVIGQFLLNASVLHCVSKKTVPLDV